MAIGIAALEDEVRMAQRLAGPGVEDVVLTQVILTQSAASHSVTPRMVVSDITAGVEFLRAVFGAAVEVDVDRPAKIHIGDSLVLVTADGTRDLFPTFLYVYVDDADRVFRRALAAGAVSLEDPADAPYGDRRAMVRDPFGNVFQIAHRRT